ncbi:MAG TPA: DNA polymerase III subunit delta [Solirubrobacteraceae bacterium]
MPTFKPAYLIHGDDHGRLAERRSRLRALAQDASGEAGVQVLEADNATPEAVAAALNAPTFALGRRFIVVDGTERWKDKDLEPLERALKAPLEETTVAFFAREDSRAKAPAGLHKLVKRAGGDVSAENNVKQWELPKWVAARARELDLELDPGAARALVQHVGERQQRLLRELEKLALGAGPGARISTEEVEALTAPSAERRAWSLADALVAGDGQAATRVFFALRAQGERTSGLIYWMAQRLRDALAVAQALEAGASAGQVKRTLRMPSRAADKLIEDASRAGTQRLKNALEEIADLELESRGGGSGGASEDTAALRAIQRIAG